MGKERFKMVPASYLVLIKGGKILLLRRYNTGYEYGNYSFIAGHLDGNETFIEAIVREAKEEAGIVIKPEGLEMMHVMHKKVPDHERIDFFVKAGEWENEPKIMEPHKCDDLSWFELDNLPSNTIPYIRQALDCIKNRAIYSEFGW